MLKEKMIQGAGNTCIFFHNACLSQYVLEGKHPSSYLSYNSNPYINFLEIENTKKFSKKISGVPENQIFSEHFLNSLEIKDFQNLTIAKIMLKLSEVNQ